jgi:hypothetical protein
VACWCAARLLTHPVQGLDNYRQLIDTLTSGKNVIKAFCEIAPLDAPPKIVAAAQPVTTR